jgi:outer membrane lipoprotein-sorting protein
MKKIIFVLGLLFVLGGCGINKNNKQAEDISKVEEKGVSVKDLLTAGDQQKCSWTVNNEDQRMTGEIWIRDKKFKQTIGINNPGAEKIEVVAVFDGQWIYTWNSQTKTGTKVKVEPSSETGSRDILNSINVNKKYEYDCQQAAVSEEEMAVPSDVRFEGE